VVAGGADNDPAGVTTFSIVGALTGFSQLWILVVTTPMETAVQTICGVVGAETRHGLADLLRLRFGWFVGLSVTFAFVVGNFAALTADTLILSDSLSLLTRLPRWYFPVLIVFLSWHLLVFHNFRKLIGTLVVFNLGFLAYAVAAFALHPGLRQILIGTFIPHWAPRGVSQREFIASAAALVGCRLSPYMFFWQASAETEKYTDVRLRNQTVLDITAGMILSNLIGYFIMITTAATLHVQGLRVESVRAAALALQPVAGRATFVLYTLGIVGSGLIAIPVLSAASSYAIAEAMAWRSGLENRPWQARRFYVVLSGALLVVALLSYLPFDTVKLAFWSQVFWGVLAPPILVLLMFLERRHSVRKVAIPSSMRAWLGAAVVLSAVVAVLVLVV
jgi:Mn2+/Fe2+ NRAMP family transporter